MMKSIPKSSDLLLYNVTPTKPKIDLPSKIDELLEEFKKRWFGLDLKELKNLIESHFGSAFKDKFKS